MFTYFIPQTVNLTKNSKLEKFVHELNALWKLSGSSMGALRELVAFAGLHSLFEQSIPVWNILSNLTYVGIQYWQRIVLIRNQYIQHT